MATATAEKTEHNEIYKSNIAFTCDAEDLANALADNVAGGTIAILRHAVLNAFGGKLTITTTNTAVTLSDRINATTKGEGTCTVHADMLRKALTGLSGEVKAEFIDGHLILKQGRRRFTFFSFNPADMPLVSDQHETDLGLAGGELATALARVGYCAPKNDYRARLNGVWLGGHRAAATDGHRAAVYDLGTAMPEEITVPTSAFALVQNIAGRGGAVAKIARPSPDSRPSELVVTAGALQIRARLLTEKFVNIEQITKQAEDAPNTVKFMADDLAAVLARVIPFTDTKNTAVLATYTKDGLQVSPVGHPDTVDVVPCEQHAGAFDCAMSATYLLDVMRQLKGSQVEWSMIDGPRAAMGLTKLTGFNDDKPTGAVHYVMPVAR